MPYLLNGSVGIGMALDDYLYHRPDGDLREAADRIERAARGYFYVEPGLFSGRAGMVLYLARRAASGRLAGRGEVIAEQVGRLRWHAVGYQGELAFPGQQLLRLSMDLATGNAGVLLALAAATDPHRAYLPFLAPVHPQTPGPAQRTAADRSLVHHG
jgi:hypothetical protein